MHVTDNRLESEKPTYLAGFEAGVRYVLTMHHNAVSTIYNFTPEQVRQSIEVAVAQTMLKYHLGESDD